MNSELLVLVALWCLSGVVGLAINAAQGKNMAWGFLGGFFFTVFGWIYLMLHHPQPTAHAVTRGPATTRPHQSDATEWSGVRAADRTKTCPQCAEEVKVAALICRFCRYEFPASVETTSQEVADPWDAASLIRPAAIFTDIEPRRVVPEATGNRPWKVLAAVAAIVIVVVVLLMSQGGCPNGFHRVLGPPYNFTVNQGGTVLYCLSN